MRRLRVDEGGRALVAVAVVIVIVAGLAVLVPTAEGPAPAAHAQLGSAAAEPGMIVVGDPGNERFQVFHPDGTFAFKFGTLGGEARSIDVGPDGTSMVMVSQYGTVHVFYPNLTYAFEFAGGVGEGVGQTSRSTIAAAVGPDGRIVVLEPARVQVFGPDGEFESLFALRHGSVRDVDIGPDGLIILADQGDYMTDPQIRAFHYNGTPAFSFPLADWEPNTVVQPLRVAVGPDGEIVTVESGWRPGGGGATPNTVLVYRPLPNGTFSHFPFNGTTYQPGPNGTLMSAPPDINIPPWPYNNIRDIAVGPDGRIIVGRQNNVTVFHPNGTLALTFGGPGSVQGGFDRPTDAAVGPDGRIVVAEPGNVTISVFHPNGTLAFAFGRSGGGDDAFYEPRHVAVAPDGRIVVGDTRKHRILVFESDGMPALAFGSYGTGVGKFRNIADVAVGPDGSVVVVDGWLGYSRGTAQVFSPDGSSVFTLQAHGPHGGWSPGAAAVGPDGRIMVTDYTNRQVHVFDPNGTKAFAIHTGLSIALDRIAVGPDGRIVLVYGGSSHVFSPDGEFMFATEIDVDAVSVAIGPNREIVVVDDRDDRVQVFNPDGTFAFSLLPDLSEGKFGGSVGAIAVGPLMPPLRGDPEPLWTSIEPEEGGVGGAPILRNFTNVGDAANVTIDVSGLAGPGGADALNGSESSIVTFPMSGTVVAASFAEVTFPPNVTASHVPAGGRLALRIAADVPAAEQVQAALGRNGSGTPEVIVLLQGVVEVGAEAGPRIMFDLPVRISLEGQAGGRAFYIEGGNGTIVPIDGACAADGADAVHRQLGGVGECQMDSVDGTAKIIYTYHLTKFGTVSIEGPVPGRTNAVDPPAPVPQDPDAVEPPPEPAVEPPPEPVVVDPPPSTEVDVCGIDIDFPALDMGARPGEYSEPVEQVVYNLGTLSLAQVEIEATPWHDGSGPPTPPPLPGVPPPYSGPTEGRTAGAFTMYMIASLPASVTEVSEGIRTDGRQEAIAGEYEALADSGAAGPDVLEGLGPGAEASLWFRLNLTPYDALLAGALVQSITYQAECVPP